MQPDRQHYNALSAYRSYDLAWLGPIFYPLALALLAQAIVYADMIRHRRCPMAGMRGSRVGAPPSAVVDSTVLAILLCESIFGILCLISCVMNRANQAYVGGTPLCDFQAFYSTYYVFAGQGLGAYGIVVGAYLRVKGTASLRVVLGAAAAIHAIAVLIAALPLMGAGAYLFAIDVSVLGICEPARTPLTVVHLRPIANPSHHALCAQFCTMDIESNLFTGLTLTVYFTCVLAIVTALAWERHALHARGSAAAAGCRRLCVDYVLAAWFVIAWFTVALLGLLFLANGKVYNSPQLGAYGVMAMFTHTNQLAVPLVFGMWWRRGLHARMATLSSATGAEGGESLKNVAVAPSTGSQPPSLPPSPPASEAGALTAEREMVGPPYIV